MKMLNDNGKVDNLLQIFKLKRNYFYTFSKDSKVMNDLTNPNTIQVNAKKARQEFKKYH
jgi:hypothetical protein